MNETKNKKQSSFEDNFLKFLMGLGTLFLIAYKGHQNFSNRYINFFIAWIWVCTTLVVKIQWHLLPVAKVFKKHPAPLTWTGCLILSCIFTSVVCFFVFMILALPRHLKLIKYQNIFDRISLKNGIGDLPQLTGIYQHGAYKELLFFRANGVSLAEFENRRDNFATAFGKTVSEIKLSKNKKTIEVLLTEKDLPEIVEYTALNKTYKQPYSFIIGESLEKVLYQRIDALPHLLVAGTSGGGKSNFFRQALLSLLKNSPHIQLYLLDLKMGIEVVEFTDLPNVRIAKDEKEAVFFLEKIVLEMKERFKYLEQNKKKKIDPYEDHKDLIVIGVDEASVIFGKDRAGSDKKEYTDKARACIEDLAKLARAAGIHLVLATQKAVKEAIDTKVLENLQGRMAFKMLSTAGSTVALGNKKAQELDNIKGRGIWQNGTLEVEVQTPYVTDEVLIAEIQIIKEEFESGKRKVRGSMIYHPKDKNKEVVYDLNNSIISQIENDESKSEQIRCN